MAKFSILNQSAMAMVAQANQAQSAVLAVLQQKLSIKKGLLLLQSPFVAHLVFLKKYTICCVTLGILIALYHYEI